MINMSCFVTDQTSYGLVSLNILEQLRNNLDVEVALYPCNEMPTHQVTEKHFIQPYMDSLKLAQRKLNPAVPSFRINHQFNMANSIGYGTRIGYTFFEMNQFTELEQDNLNSLDRLIVSSKWAKDICDTHLKVNTEIVPLGVDRTIFEPVEHKPKKCIFLSIGKWEVRKDQNGIVEAYNKAFNLEDPVELWMLYDSMFMVKKDQNDISKQYKESKMGDSIRILSRVPKLSDIARLINSSFCFVSNSKAEAWNMELLEAMSCGKHCISPKVSGESEYMTDENVLITESDGLIEAKDNRWFGKGLVNTGEWASPNQDSLVHNMRAVLEMFKSNYFVNEEGIATAKKFSWEKTARKIKEIADA